MLAYVTWEASPEIITIGPITLRWYGLMFAVGFSLGFAMVRRMFLAENQPEEWLDSLFLYLVVGTILGARLGHWTPRFARRHHHIDASSTHSIRMNENHRAAHEHA